jgi:hypothetical protein
MDTWHWLVAQLSSMHPMDAVGLVIGIVGVAFGLKQYYDQKSTERRLQGIRDQLKIADEGGDALRADLKLANDKLAEMHDKSLTIAIARFPYNLNALIDFIDNARGELVITCDFIGYAVYSNVSGFLSYLAALQRATDRKVEIRLLLYGLDTARQAIGKQLPAADYPRERDSDCCRDYFDAWHKGQPIPSSYNEFRDTLLRDEENLMARLKGVKLKVTDHSFLAFAWIANQTEACIFAFRTDGEDEAGMTFLSKDKHIATDFRSVFDLEWERAADPIYKGRW